MNSGLSYDDYISLRQEVLRGGLPKDTVKWIHDSNRIYRFLIS